MGNRTTELAKGGPYVLIQRDNLKTRRRDYLVKLNTGLWRGNVGMANPLNDHFGPANRIGVWIWRFESRVEATELISLAVLKGLM